MNYYIADQHFGHDNIIEYDNRPFDSVEEMDQYMIDAHNSVVTDDDDVFFVGDFAYWNEKPHTWYLERLKGKKHLVLGNHDVKLMRDSVSLDYFKTVDKMRFIKDGNEEVVLCHYPMLKWFGSRDGHYHIHGHNHTRIDESSDILKNMDRALNAGAPIIDYKPRTLEQLIEYNKKFKSQ